MRLALGPLALKAASWRDGRGKRRGFVGLKLGALALELHLRPRHYAAERPRLAASRPGKRARGGGVR